jgi:hypothetical protein
MLADHALEHRGLFIELTARASRLRGLQHRLLTLRSKPIEADDQLDERVKQRQADQEETEEDEL